MPIPKAILAVERPKNTVVAVYGKNKNLYAVKKRTGCKRVDGKNRPVTGPTIGHIVDGKYVPNEEIKAVTQSNIDLRDWGIIEYADKLLKSTYDELCEHYCTADALKIYCIAILRTCYPGIKDYELKSAYENSFLSVKYPDVALSKNSVSYFIRCLGQACSHIVAFMRARVAKVEKGHHVIIDGTLKSDENKVNTLSNFSRKAKLKGSKDISVIYAYDLETREPICSECFPGNILDITSYERFISDNNLKTGIIVADKGFPAKAAGNAFKENPDLHYLNPIKRNAKLTDENKMLNYDGVLPGFEGILYKKDKVQGRNKWLYSFRDAKKAAQEELGWLKKASKDDEYNDEELKKSQQTFGTIVLESDLDVEPADVYRAYACRWEIEIVMRYYKTALEFDETRVHDDYAVFGTEFIDFIASVLTMRVIKDLDNKKILEETTYGHAMAVLKRAKKIKLDNAADWQLVKLNPSQEKLLQTLGVLEALTELPKRRRGRPKKSA